MTSENEIGMKAMTLRIDHADAERLRRLAFDERVSQSDIVRLALREYLNRLVPIARGRGVCDNLNCERDSVMTTTPGGFRFCDDHKPREVL